MQEPVRSPLALDVAVQSVRPRSRRRLARFAAVTVGAGLVIGGVLSAMQERAPGEPPGEPPASAGGPGRIAVVDAAGTLSTVAADGSDRRTYPLPGFVAGFPAWSPDGLRVAVIASSAAEGVVVVADDAAAGPSAPTVLLRRDPRVIYLDWSPDGSRLGVLTGERRDLALRLIDATPGQRTAPASEAPALARGQPLFWDWVDRDRLLVHSGADGADAFLGDVRIDTAEGVSVTTSIGPFQSPAVSANGGFRAYVARDPAGQSLVVVERPDGSARRDVPVRGSSTLGWSPRSNALAYTAPTQARLPGGPLRLLEAASGADRELLPGLVLAWEWAPDGNAVAAIRLVIESDGPTSTIAEPGLAAGRVAFPGPVRLAADGPRFELAFVETATGTLLSRRPIALPEIMVRQFLPFADQYARSHHLWSPASDAVVLPLLDEDGTSRITVVPADGSAVRRIGDGVLAFWGP